MSREEIERLVELWESDPAFQERLRADPTGTVQHHGIQLEPEELDALTSMDFDTVDEQIRTRRQAADYA